MREILTVPLMIYGFIAGLVISFDLAKSNKKRVNEIESAESSLELMVGSQLSAKKSLTTKILWFSFLLYITYSLLSIYVFFYHPLGRFIASLLLSLEVSEHIVHLKQIKEANSFTEIMMKGIVSKWSSYIHLVGIACLVGFLL